MYIKKQRLLTPGPTPLLPKALHAMMGSDIHHRTEDFRRIYLSVLADLKEVMGTSYDVLALTEYSAPSFAKRYAQLGDTISEAARTYAQEVRDGRFPSFG